MEHGGQPGDAVPWPSHDDWRRRLAWRQPFDKAGAEESIRAAYVAAGLPPPRTILWAGGPREARGVLSRTGWRRAGPWLLMLVALLAIVASTLGFPAREGVAAVELPRGAFVVLGLAFVAFWTFALMLSGALQEARSPLPLVGVPVAIAGALVAVGLLSSGPLVQVSPLAMLGGLLALPASILLAAQRGEARVGQPFLFGRSVAPRLSRTFHVLLDKARPAIRPRPYGLDLGDRLAAFVRLLAIACPPSFETPIAFYAVDRLVRVAPAPKAGGEAERKLAAFTDLVYRVDGLWAFAKVAVVLEPPSEVHLDEFGRFHRTDGPALRWKDGSTLFAVDGRFAADPAILLGTEELTIFHIRQEPDPGIRRALLQTYGPEKVMRELGRKVGQDGTGELWRVDDFDGEPLVMVRVINSSPEPDGSYKPYWLRVPPATPSAHAGVSWTFGLVPSRYRPQVET